MSDLSYPLFPVFAFVTFILVLIPLPWHLQAANSGTCLYMIWTAISCLNFFINSIIWHGNAIDSAPVWCDISTRLMVGSAVAIPAASLCIARRLYNITACQNATLGYAEKRRALLIDLMIGLGIPFLQMPLQFIVQGHRYDIFEDIGCLPTTVNTPAAYPLTFLWPNVIGLVSAGYCVLTIRAFMQRRVQFQQFIFSKYSITISRYFRLMALATTEIFLTIPITTYGLYLNLTSRPIYPWTSWSDIHYAWYVIDTYPGLVWRSQRIQVVILELNRWAPIFCGLVFFAFFGFADEARKSYKRAYEVASKKVGLTSLKSPSKSFLFSSESGQQSSCAKQILPTHISKPLELTSHSTQYDSDSMSGVFFIQTSFQKTESTNTASDYPSSTEDGFTLDTPLATDDCPSYSLATAALPRRPLSTPLSTPF